MMVSVQAAYLEHHLAGRPSEREARRSFGKVNAFMKIASPRNAAYRVSEFGLLKQREYIRTQAGLSPKTVSADLVAIASAVRWAAQDQVFTDGRNERQVRMLTYAPSVITSPAKVAEIMDVADAGGRREWIPTALEVSSFVDAVRPFEMAFRLTVIILNTWARRQAALDIHRGMINRQLGIISLNPLGRRQTKKRRPVIRLTRNLEAWLDRWGDDHPITSSTKQYSDVTEGFRAAARSIGLPSLSPHVLRHYCASRARAMGVPRDQIQEWLGHRVGDTTDIYLHYDGDWLKECRDATDRIAAEAGASPGEGRGKIIG